MSGVVVTYKDDNVRMVSDSGSGTYRVESVVDGEVLAEYADKYAAAEVLTKLVLGKFALAFSEEVK